MTFVHGNKTASVIVIAVISAMLMLFNGLLSVRRAKLRLYEQKYNEAVAALEENNNRKINEAD